MRKVTRLFLFCSLVLVLLTAACGADQGTTPTLSGTILPGVEETSTLPSGLDTTMTAETEMATTAETSTDSLETPTLSGTETPGVSTQATTETDQIPGIPVTGLDIVLVECQFCVDTFAHALLVLPDTATFEVNTPTTTTTTSTTTNSIDTNCSTIEVNNGKQVVLCSGPEMTPLTLNICTDVNTCTDFPVDLLACPLTPAGTLSPDTTQSAPGTEDVSATPSPASGLSTATPLSPVSTPTP